MEVDARGFEDSLDGGCGLVGVYCECDGSFVASGGFSVESSCEIRSERGMTDDPSWLVTFQRIHRRRRRVLVVGKWLGDYNVEVCVSLRPGRVHSDGNFGLGKAGDD